MFRKKKLIIFFLIIIFLFLTLFLGNFFSTKNDNITNSTYEVEEKQNNYNSNIIKDVNYQSRDAQGNEYIIDATEGQIDISNSSIIFLTNVRALIKMSSSENVTITADYGKYNIDNYDTVFSKNVKINYLDNKITSEYADFSILRNSMIVSKNVIYTNLENILKADVIEVNIETKDTIIYMHEKNKKVNIKSIE
jgi:LPS export ABC transporter protein LptC